MNLVLVAVGLLVGWVVLNVVLGILHWRGVEVSWDDVADYATIIMRGGQDGARMRLRHMASGKRVDLVKIAPCLRHPRFVGPTQFRMELHGSWCSQTEFRAAEAALRRAGLAPEVSAHGLMTVQCGTDTGKALRALRVVLEGGFGLPSDVALRAGIRGPINVRNSAMDGWDEPPPGPMPGLPHMRRLRPVAHWIGRLLGPFIRAFCRC